MSQQLTLIETVSQMPGTPAASPQARRRPVLIAALEKHWLSNAGLYGTTLAYFLVYDTAQVTSRPFYFDDVDLQSAVQTFGPPTETDTTDGYPMLIWGKDITPDIRP